MRLAWYEKPRRLLSTIGHLRPVQIAYQIRYRLFGLPRQCPSPLVARRRDVKSSAFLPPVVSAAPPDQVRFLNDPREYRLGRPDWKVAGCPKLWRYNLHYFDYLLWPGFSPDTKAAVIDDWIASNALGEGDGWEPYPVSLRVVNWMKYALAGSWNHDWTPSLAMQCAYLERTLEYHLLANHLLKNAKALVFAGLFFTGRDAVRWLGKGIDILLRQADEQFLADGGHFERSPMYHCIVLEDLLDVVQLARSNPGLLPPESDDRLTSAATRAAGFLAAIRAGDGRIPLFNDAAFGITAEPMALLDYAERVLGMVFTTADQSRARILLPDTGYYGYRAGSDSLIVDCGAIGPDYQPGHAHCDTLSYELCVGGQRIVVDTGVLDYEPGDKRQFVRSTAAHNTVRVDGVEQSETWGAFRVGRRARPIRAELTDWQGSRMEFLGSHDGYTHLPDRVVHERRIVMDRTGRWEVFDLMHGRSSRCHLTENYVHLDYQCVVEAMDDGRRFMIKHKNSDLCLLLTVTCGSAARLEPAYHFPEFGLRQSSQMIVMERRGSLPLEMHYRIERL